MSTHPIIIYRFRDSYSYDNALALDAHAIDFEGLFVSYDYDMPAPGLYTPGSEAEYDAIVWNDTNYSKPSWSDVQHAYADWLINYPVADVQMQDVVALGDDAADHYHGTTQYITTKLRTYTNVGTTDSNGRVVVNLTDDGLSTGAALFSSVFAANAIGSDNSGDPMQAPLMILESISGNTYTFRAIIGGTVDPLQFASSGITVYVHVTGIK